LGGAPVQWRIELTLNAAAASAAAGKFMEGLMPKFYVAILVLSLGACAGAQTAPKSTTAKPATSSTAKPATPAAAKQPIQAVIQTTAGDFNCTLFPDKSPITVDNFVGLATGTKDWKNPVNGATMHNRPFYDGTVFHRVIPNFMIQGGDPLGNGTGGPGYSFRDEQSDLTFDVPGRLAMANSGPNTNGSQFFITEAPTPHLDGHYNIFGQCDNNALVKQIARAATDPRNDRPFSPVKIVHIKITDPNKPATSAKKPATATGTGATKKTTTPASKPQ
jgi:cyclophilin family peptidyl-prolyl cis-trans isomerase